MGQKSVNIHKQNVEEGSQNGRGYLLSHQMSLSLPTKFASQKIQRDCGSRGYM